MNDANLPADEYEAYSDETMRLLDEWLITHGKQDYATWKGRRDIPPWKPDHEALERVHGPEYAAEMRPVGEAR